MKPVISFPRVANYDVPVSYFIRHAFDAEPLPPPPNTKRTLELGSQYSPDFVCSPFKYVLGNYIEALELGANTLIMLGGPCRLGYYGELHEQILHDLGYEFTFVNLAEFQFRRKPQAAWEELKRWNEMLSIKELADIFLICSRMVDQMDSMDAHIRENIGFEAEPGTYDRIYRSYLNDAAYVKSLKELKRLGARTMKELKEVKTEKPKNLLRVGIIGEYYTIMEPFSNHFLEKELAAKQICITRTINVSYSLFRRKIPQILKGLRGYLTYDIGATGIDTVNAALSMAKKKYDGLIHVKSFGCTPEIDAMPVLQNISSDYKIPILYFSFDSQTSETGIQTRLEAFQDMIVMRKGRK